MNAGAAPMTGCSQFANAWSDGDSVTRIFGAGSGQPESAGLSTLHMSSDVAPRLCPVYAALSATGPLPERGPSTWWRTPVITLPICTTSVVTRRRIAVGWRTIGGTSAVHHHAVGRRPRDRAIGGKFNTPPAFVHQMMMFGAER